MNNIHRVWFGTCEIDYDYHFSSCDQYLSDYNSYEWTDKNKEDFFALSDSIDKRIKPLFLKYFDYKSLLSDIIRYCVLYKHGGIYTDYDVEYKSNFLRDAIEDNNFEIPVFLTECILTDDFIEQSKSFPNREGEPEDPIRVASFCLYSPPNNPIIRDIIDLIIIRLSIGLKPSTDYDIIWLAGPDTISTIVNNTKHDYILLNPEFSDCIHYTTGNQTWRTLFNE